MTEPTALPDDLSFERAQSFAPKKPCTACGESITRQYYLVNGERTCDACVAKRELNAGTGGGRFSRALAFGAGAAALCSLLWYGIATITGYELGIVAIVVGAVVGVAVRIGSEERGGWKYQLLAMGLTYLAIVAAYVPGIVAEFRMGAALAEATAEMDEEDYDEDGEEEYDDEQAADEEGELAHGDFFEDEDWDDDDNAVPDETPLPEFDEEDLAIRGAALMPTSKVLLWAIPIALFAPVLLLMSDFAGSITWMFLLCIAIYEAWKINHSGPPSVQGPFGNV